MSEATWDGHRAVDTNRGETQFRVRGNRLVNPNTVETFFRVRADGRVVDANTLLDCAALGRAVTEGARPSRSAPCCHVIAA